MTFIDKFTQTLRGWIGVVSLLAFGNTIQCFLNHTFLKNNLYIEASNEGD